jgi:hypothetical protein
MNRTSKIVSAVIILLIVGGASFYFGMNYGKSQSKPAFAAANFSALRGTRTGANGANLVSGDIISKDSSSITLQVPNNGGSKIIFYSSATQISKFAAGTPNDLAAGTSVIITGATNSDGSITAQSIQIRPAQNRGVNQ